MRVGKRHSPTRSDMEVAWTHQAVDFAHQLAVVHAAVDLVDPPQAPVGPAVPVAQDVVQGVLGDDQPLPQNLAPLSKIFWIFHYIILNL